MIDWKKINWKQFGTDKASSHCFDRVYPVLFNGLPDTSILMEIGVQNGSSLLLWESIFSKWGILGIDIVNKPAPLEGHAAIEYIQADAYCDETIKGLERFYGQCSVVIDDGSHKAKDMCFFAKEYPKLLKSGGIVIIEDMYTVEMFSKVQSCLPEPLKSNSFMVDLRMFKQRIDDILLVAFNP